MRLLILDANSILNRAFYGIRLLSTKDGFFTNAIYGFLTTLEKLKEETKPDNVAMAFDMKAPTFRHKSYEDYKAGRKGMPDELAQQLPVLKELLTAFGYTIIECEGYEADDIIGTVANICKKNSCECVIATGDRDSLQLVDENVSVRLAVTKMGKPEVTLYDEDKINEIYSLLPKQLIDVKAIQGDTSDNIPGVKGIGEKGALALVQEFGSLDNIYENISSEKIKEGTRKKLLEGKDSAYLSYKLGTIVTDVPIKQNIENYTQKPIDYKKVTEIMKRLEFFSLMEKMGIDSPKIENSNNKQIDFNVTSCDDINFLNSEKTVDMVFEYDASKIKKAAIATNGNIYILEKQELIRKLLNSKINISTYDCKTLYKTLIESDNYNFNVDFDLLLAAYIINPSTSEYKLEDLAKSKNICIKLNNSQDTLATEVAYLSVLKPEFQKEIIKNNQEFLLKEIEIKLSKVLAQMENTGFEINSKELEIYGKELENEADKLSLEIYDEAGHEFNINSPKQLATVLFEEMGLPYGKKTKTGFSTSADVLNKLSISYPIVNKILEYRTLTKLKSTFCDSIIKLVSEDGRIHTNFNQTETRTGRISSTEPNLQNIPVRTEIGKNLRKFFCAKEGYVLVDADYSQIELRILAHISGDKIMIEAFNNNNDIHSITASQIFDMPLRMVTPLMRSRAKTINFGIIYGMGAFTLSQNLNISRKEATKYIENYFERYKGVAIYMHDIVERARANKFVETIFARRRYLPELSSSNFTLRSFGERVAMNMPIQGSSADIIKLAMIKVHKRLEDEKLDAKIILQVHDELIVEAKEELKEQVTQILKEEMENVIKLDVPLLADAFAGKNWYEAKA